MLLYVSLTCVRRLKIYLIESELALCLRIETYATFDRHMRICKRLPRLREKCHLEYCADDFHFA